MIRGCNFEKLLAGTLCTTWLLLAISFPSSAQPTTGKQFKRLSRPEKCWVITHPFVAKKAWRITQQVQLVVKQTSLDTLLDSDANGGQLDAFRHAYWMAMLSQQIHWRKAKKLGKAHERANKLDFRHGRLEDGAAPDAAASEMDLYNNEKGIEIGRACLNKARAQDAPSPEEVQSLVIEAILNGQLLIIRKAPTGIPLDSAGHIIPNEKLQGQWVTPRCLVPSNQ